MSDTQFTSDSDELPPEFTGTHRRLLADSQAWVRRLPSSDRLNHYAWQLEHEERATASARHPSSFRSVVRLLPKGQVPRIMSQPRTRTLIPAIAVLIIVVLLGFVLAEIRIREAAANHPVHPSPTTAATRTKQAHNWVHLPQLDSNARFDSNNPTALAPTDPQVVYQTFAQDAHSNGPNGNATMRRSDDGGQTWHPLTFPVPPTHVNYAGIEVSPLDAHSVLLAIFDTFANLDCPSYAIQYSSEGNLYDCWLDYYSGDGGVHWTPIYLPFVDRGIDPPVAEGTRLFAHVYCVDFSCSHLMSSADGGKTWQLADHDILAQMKGVCLVAAASTTVFAVASTGSCRIDQTAQHSVWQSNDAGAHWQSNGPLPGNTVTNIVAVPTATTPLLYTLDSTTTFGTIESPDDTARHITDVRVSADDGKTWMSAPTTGFPSGQKVAFDYGIWGVLTDGRVILQSIPQKSMDTFAGSTLMAWKFGSTSWQQVAPPLKQEIGELIVTPANQSTQGTIWVVTQYRGGTEPGVTVTTTAVFTVLSYTN